MKIHSRAFQKGAALIITLAILVIITVLAVGIADSVRVERSSSDIHEERTRALLLAQTGVERVVAKLQKNTADVERHWLSQPGQIVVGAEEDDSDPANGDPRKILANAKSLDDAPGPMDPRIVSLHSGRAQPPYKGGAIFTPPNLNIATFLDPARALITDHRHEGTGNLEEMRVRWIYVRKDGSIDTAEVPALNDKNNPLVGRYAYWVDDESAKINYNLAWKKDGNDPVAGLLPTGHPSNVSLAALDAFASDPSLADQLHSFVTEDNYETFSQRPFNSPEDGRQVSPAVGAALRDSKFDLTHYNHDPDTTFFNEPRIVLTTQESRAEGRPYLKVLADETKDPGLRSNLDEAKLNDTLFGPNGTYTAPKSPGLLYYLCRRDWPMVEGGGSLQDKYFSGDISQLIEFAVNIIDYVRSAESSMEIVEPIRGIPFEGKLKGEWVAANSTLRPGGIAGAESTFKGLTRQPMITEMAALFSSVSANNCRVFVEVHLPQNYGLDAIDLNGLSLIFQIRKDGVPKRDCISDTTAFSTANLLDSDTQGTLLKKGGYRVYTKRLTIPPTRQPVSGETVNLRAVLNRISTNVRLELAPVGDSMDVYVPSSIGTQYIVPTLLPTTAALTAAPLPSLSLQTDDPRVNGIGPDWQLKAATWGENNSVAVPIPNLQPPQDTTKSWNDSTGKIVGAVPQYRDATLHMPAPKGSGKNPHGVVSSVGELGFIHTGLQITSQRLPVTDPPTPNPPGIPWRTIRLQPSSSPLTVVPDWVFMDLFTVPTTVPDAAKSLFTPHATATSGRVNLNSKVEPYSLTRLDPLAAVFLGASHDATQPDAKITPESASALARNVYERKLASGGKQYGYLQGYDSPGEMVEIEGIADQGEASEELVRQVSNLVTTRGNVFSVYSIGQALKQTPAGGLHVTAEQRRHTMLERFQDASTKQIHFRTIYGLQLTP